MSKPRVVVCAALLNNDDEIICSPRHFDSTARAAFNWNDHWWNAEQGFVDQFGVFMSREEAWKVAEAAGQIKYRCGGDGKELFSENLY
jgi:hypothetical protein